MDKKIAKKNKSLLIVLSQLLFLVGMSFATNAQELFPVFKDKSEITQWIKSEYGDFYVSSEDTASFTVGFREFFIFFPPHGSGLIRRDIFLFSNRNDIKTDGWSLLCMRHTKESQVSATVNENSHEIIFKGEANRTIMISYFDDL